MSNLTDTPVPKPTLIAARQLFAEHSDTPALLHTGTSNSHDLGPTIYLCDVASGRTLLLQTKAGELQRVSAQVDFDERTFNSMRQALNVLIDDLLTSTTIDSDTRHGVILGAVWCVSETRGFQLTRHHGAGVQHLLLRYLDVATKHYQLTPMPLFKPHPIAAADLNATATHVLLSEQLNFPDRFATGKPLGFTEVRRNVLAGKPATPSR